MAEPNWIAVARRYLGESEVSGSSSNPKITGFFKRAVGKAFGDETAWCAAFVGSCLIEAGKAGSGKLNARSYLDWGQPIATPRLGCVVVFSRGDPKGWQGHVGFWMGEDSGKVIVLGGNQGNRVSLARYAKSRVLGYRWPSDQPLPAAAAAAAPKLDVAAVQRRLKDLGYHEVGNVDGAIGSRTRGAIQAFKADWNDLHPDKPLAVDAALDQATLAALMVAPKRAVSPTRATATAADLRAEGSRTIAATDAIKVVSVATGGTAAIGKVLDESGVIGGIQKAGEATGPARMLIDLAVDYWWLIAIGCAGLALWYAVKAARARLSDHREGELA